jgi:hypothetical protein
MGHVGGPCLPGKEWFSQVELGVFITFVTLSNGCNAFKRIRFRYYTHLPACSVLCECL